MTLPAVNLDDLTWEDLRALSVRRIPAASGARWTHHAPVDSGITLLELFAFLLDQQVFVIDQVPDSLVGAILTLLGERQRPVGIARTVLRVDAMNAWVAGQAPAMVPEGTIVRPDRSELSDLQFTTMAPMTPLPTAKTDLFVNGEDRSIALQQARPVTLMSGRDAPGEVVLHLHLDQDVPAQAAQAPVSLLILLDTVEAVAPEWAADAAEAPPPATFEFAYRRSGGGWKRFTAGSVEDGTGGFRRSGLLRLPLPLPGDLATANLLSLRIRTESASYSAPPKLLDVIPNAVIAHHRARREAGVHMNIIEDLRGQIAKWLPHSGLGLDLPSAFDPPIAETVTLRLQDRDGNWRKWRPVDDLAFSGPADRIFTVDREGLRLAFGDGYAGRVPAPAQDIALSLEVGGGPSGNLGKDQAWTAEDPAIQGGYMISSVVAARDGSEPETLREARERVAASLSEPHRAVTQQDYVTIVETTPGIESHRAHVAVGYHPAFPCAFVPDAITVFVVPSIDRSAILADPEAEIGLSAPRPDPGALRAIRARLDRARLIATQVFVIAPNYRAVALEVTAVADAPEPAVLGARVRRALARHLDPLIGGNKEKGWPFGRPLRPSEFVRIAQAALGDNGTVETVAVGLDGAAPEEACTDVEIGAHDLVYLASFRLNRRASLRQQRGAL